MKGKLYRNGRVWQCSYWCPTFLVDNIYYECQSKCRDLLWDSKHPSRSFTGVHTRPSLIPDVNELRGRSIGVWSVSMRMTGLVFMYLVLIWWTELYLLPLIYCHLCKYCYNIFCWFEQFFLFLPQLHNFRVTTFWNTTASPAEMAARHWIKVNTELFNSKAPSYYNWGNVYYNGDSVY